MHSPTSCSQTVTKEHVLTYSEEAVLFVLNVVLFRQGKLLCWIKYKMPNTLQNSCFSLYQRSGR